MAGIQRSASAVWEGDLRGGSGKISGASTVLQDAAYTFATRFENAAGTNPEELIAAAHAACFSMAFSGNLAEKGFTAERISTRAVLTMDKRDGKNTIVSIRLEVEGKVPGVDAQVFQQSAEQAKQNCPISRLLKPGLESIELDAKLVE